MVYHLPILKRYVVCVCAHVRAHVSVCVHICVCAYTYPCVYTSVCVCVCTRLCVCAHVFVHAHCTCMCVPLHLSTCECPHVYNDYVYICCSYPYTFFVSWSFSRRRASHSYCRHEYWILQVLILTCSAREQEGKERRCGIMHHMISCICITWSHTLCITWSCALYSTYVAIIFMHTQRDTGVVTHQTLVKFEKAEVTKNSDVYQK